MKAKAYSAQEIANGAKAGTWEQQNRQNHVVPANLPSSGNQGSGSGAGNGVSSGSGAGKGENTKAAEENVAFKEVKPSDHLTRHEGQGFTIYYPDNWKVAGDADMTIIGAAIAGRRRTVLLMVSIIGNQPGSGLIGRRNTKAGRRAWRKTIRE